MKALLVVAVLTVRPLGEAQTQSDKPSEARPPGGGDQGR